MTPKVPMSETGTATLGMKVERTIAEEDEDNEDDEQDRDTEGNLDVPDRGADRAGRVDRDRQRDRRRNGRLELRQQGPDAVHGLDDVGPRLAEHDDQDRRLPVGEASRADILDRVGHGRDVGETHPGPVAVMDDQRPILRGREELIRRREIVMDRWVSAISPFGRFALAAASAARTSSNPRPLL